MGEDENCGPTRPRLGLAYRGVIDHCQYGIEAREKEKEETSDMTTGRILSELRKVQSKFLVREFINDIFDIRSKNF